MIDKICICPAGASWSAGHVFCSDFFFVYGTLGCSPRLSFTHLTLHYRCQALQYLPRCVNCCARFVELVFLQIEWRRDRSFVERFAGEAFYRL